MPLADWRRSAAEVLAAPPRPYYLRFSGQPRRGGVVPTTWRPRRCSRPANGAPLPMLNGKRILVVMPAYNAAKTLVQTYKEVPREFVDEVILVDDGSHDETSKVAAELGLTTFVHRQNLGYGRNQKTCYREALRRGADIVVMLHPDYQYSPNLIVSL